MDKSKLHNFNLHFVRASAVGSDLIHPNLLNNYVPPIVQSLVIKKFPDNLVSSDNGSTTISFSLKSFCSDLSELILPFVSFEVPAIISKNSSDVASYCPMFALNLISHASLSIHGKPAEQLDTNGLIAAIKIRLGDNFDYSCNKYFGGINGPLQQPHKPDQNKVLIDKVLCQIPLPFKIFNSEQKLPTLACGDILMQINIQFHPLSKVLTVTDTSHLDYNNGYSIEMFMAGSQLNPYVHNNHPLVNNNLQKSFYLFHGKSITSLNKELSFPIMYTLQKNPTTEYALRITNSTFANGKIFLGSSNEECRQNFWASLIQKKSDRNMAASIQLNQKKKIKENDVTREESFTSGSMVFLNGEKTWVEYSFEKIDAKTIKLISKKPLGQTETIISSTIEFDNYPSDFCLDLNVFSSFNPNKLILKPEAFSTVKFDIEKFNPNKKTYTQETSKKDGTFTLLNGALFSFWNDEKTQEYAFLGIKDLKKNDEVSEAYYEIMPCRQCGFVKMHNIFIPHKYKRVNLPGHTFYDFDKKFPIEVEKYTLNSSGDVTGAQEINYNQMELERSTFLVKNQKYNFDDYQIHRKIELIKNETGAGGFKAFEYSSITVILKDIELELNNKLIENFQRLDLNLNINILQFFLHFLVLNPNSLNSKVKEMSASDADHIVDKIVDSDTQGEEIFSHCFRVEEFPQDQESTNGINQMTKRELNKKKRKLDEFVEDGDDIREEERHFPILNRMKKRIIDED